ncbi:hypothetical protein ACFPRL_03670 [Pseudoclavibacter helvolus]
MQLSADGGVLRELVRRHVVPDRPDDAVSRGVVGDQFHEELVVLDEVVVEVGGEPEPLGVGRQASGQAAGNPGEPVTLGKELGPAIVRCARR